MQQIEVELGQALYSLKSERDKQYSEIENLKNEIFGLKAEKSLSRSPAKMMLSTSQQSSKLGASMGINLSRHYYKDDVQTPTNFPRQVNQSPRKPTILTSLSTPGFESCSSQAYLPTNGHIKVMGEREEVEPRVLQPRD